MAVLSAPVERIRETPRVDMLRLLLTTLALLPYVLGWTAGKTWFALRWMWDVVRAGWLAAVRVGAADE